MGEREGARPSGVGPPPVLLRAGLRVHTHLSVPCRMKRMEEEEEVRSGGGWAPGAGAELGLIFQFLCLSLSPKSALILLCPHP